MHRLGGGVASLASALWLAGCEGAIEGRSGAGQAGSHAASVGANLGEGFSGRYLWVHGKRSTPVDGRYPCLAEVTACLALDASGRSAALGDLCPSSDTPAGTWDFDFALYTDGACTQPFEGVACVVARGERLSAGQNPSTVLCISSDAEKDFTVCLYDPVTKAGHGNCERVLIVTGGVPAAFVEDVQAKQVATGRFSRVDAFDASVATPTLADLSGYTVVLTFTDHYQSLGYGDPFGMGDALAAYFDSGGRVVVAVFANAAIPILGRFAADYLLIQPLWYSAPASALGTIEEPGSPLLADVTALTADDAYSSIGSVIHGGVVVARWSDGLPLIVRGTLTDGAGATRNRADLNLYPPSSGVVDPFSHSVRTDLWTGDGTEIIRNALLYK